MAKDAKKQRAWRRIVAQDGKLLEIVTKVLTKNLNPDTARGKMASKGNKNMFVDANDPVTRDVFYALKEIQTYIPESYKNSPHMFATRTKANNRWFWGGAEGAPGIHAIDKINGVLEKHTNSNGEQIVNTLNEQDVSLLVQTIARHSYEVEKEQEEIVEETVKDEKEREEAGAIMGDIAEAQQLILFKEYIKSESKLHPAGTSGVAVDTKPGTVANMRWSSGAPSMKTLVTKNKKASSLELYSKLVTSKFDPKFLSVNNAQWSLLVPKITLKSVKFKNTGGIHKKVPGSTRYFVFSDFLQPKSLKNLTSDKIGRGDGVGLKSVSIELRQEHFADKRYVVKISIFFENAQTIRKQDLSAKAIEQGYSDLVWQRFKSGNFKYPPSPVIPASFVDLLKLPDGDELALGTGEYKQWHLTYGWAVPPKNSLIDEKMSKFIQKLQTTLILNVYRWQFKFDQDGSVVLDVDFLADEDHRASSNMLYSKKAEDKIRSGKEDYKESQEKAKRAKEALDTYKGSKQLAHRRAQEQDAGFGPKERKRYNELKKKKETEPDEELQDSGESKEYKKLENAKRSVLRRGGGITADERIEVLQEQYEDALNQSAGMSHDYQDLIYSSFINELLKTQRIIVGVAERSWKKRAGDKKASNFRYSFTSHFKVNPGAGKKVAASLAGTVKDAHDAANLEAVKESHGNVTDADKAATKAAEYHLLKGTEALIKDLKIKPQGATPGTMNDVVVIPYFFLGDIIDIAYQNHSSRAGKTAQPILGSLDVDMARRVKGKPAPTVKRDISRIPISFTSFMLWWNNKVVRTQKEVWAFKPFLRELFQQFVGKIIDEYDPLHIKYFGGKPDKKVWHNTESAINIEQVDSPLDITTAEYRGPRPNDIDVDKVLSAKSKLAGKATAHRTEEFHSYLFIYGQAGRIYLDCNPRKNMESGIYHFYVGGDGGIMKSIEFNVVPNEMRRTVQVLAAAKDKKNNPFLEQYDVTIKMRGNNIFRPGVLIYVDLSLIGFGKSNQTNTISYEYNLGGYYRIIKTDHQISGDDYETIIVARTDGFSGKGILAKHQPKKQKK